jgi:hypothetical protein
MNELSLRARDGDFRAPGGRRRRGGFLEKKVW